MTYATREEWLNAAVNTIGDWFKELDVTLPTIRVSCGWSKRSGKGIGWCWKSEASSDGTNEILISPEVDDPVRVLATLVHEAIHASDNGKSKHSGYFKTIAENVGLTGKMTATVAGEDLEPRLIKLADQLGPYPHAAINPSADTGDKKQTTRMLKVVCPEDGYTVRTTRKWLEVGVPKCPCGLEMEDVTENG